MCTEFSLERLCEISIHTVWKAFVSINTIWEAFVRFHQSLASLGAEILFGGAREVGKGTGLEASY